MPRVRWGKPIAVDLPETFVTGISHPSLTEDGLRLFFDAFDGNGDPSQIWEATRASTSAPWSAFQEVSYLEAGQFVDNIDPFVSTDGLVLWFDRQRAVNGAYVAKRTSLSAPWTTLSTAGLGALGSPSLTPSRLMLAEAGALPNGQSGSDLFIATRPDTSSPWDRPSIVSATATLSSEMWPSISADGLELYYTSNDIAPQLGGACAHSCQDLMVATRASVNDPFTPGQYVDELSEGFLAKTPWISPDGHTIYFVAVPATRPQKYVYTLYLATR